MGRAAAISGSAASMGLGFGRLCWESSNLARTIVKPTWGDEGRSNP